jgi:predicted phage terminase large subunit-like protein
MAPEQPTAIAEPSAEPTKPLPPQTIRAYCETVTPAWDWTWRHLVYIDGYLDKVTRHEINRLEINLPTRIGKTEKLARYIAHRLELDPALNVILGAYNATFARRISRKVRKLVQGRVPLSRERKAVDEWETEAGGGVRAVGVGVGVAGLPAGLIVIDDPIKNREDAYSKAFRDKVDEWYREDLYTRLEPDGQIILCNARRHEDDLSGRIQASEDAVDWTVVRLPALAEADDPLGRREGEAICPQRFGEAYYAKMRRAIGEAAFASLQQQRPAPASGLIFKSDWFRYYTVRAHPIIEDGHAIPFAPDRFTEEMQSWDCSFKDKTSSDYVAGHVWKRAGANCYLDPDRVHDRLDFPKTLAAIRGLTARHPSAKRKLVEDKANGPAVIATLRTEIEGVIGIEPEGDKVARAHAVTHLFEAGQVWLPHPSIAPWVKGYVLELLQFPLGAHDDDVDATTQALRRLSRHIAAEKADDGAPPSISQSVG